MFIVVVTVINFLVVVKELRPTGNVAAGLILVTSWTHKKIRKKTFQPDGILDKINI